MRQGVQFVVSIVLARILVPEDFGVIAMLALFIGVASIFIDSGFSCRADPAAEHNTHG